METVTVTHTFDSPLDKVWHALSDGNELKKWYFPVQNYVFEIGKEFTFYESDSSHNYLHQCQFLNIIPKQLIEYSWAHPNQSKGSSVVKWEFQDEGGTKTKLTLTHSGIENFADAGPDFSKANYEMGWNAIVKTTLRNYLYGIKKLVFDSAINATKEKVWEALWGKESYTAWTKPFCEGSYYEGELAPGNRVHLLSPSGEGMYSDIAFFKENELMVFKHIGMLKEKKEVPLDAETEKWTGSFESYMLKETNGTTQLKVEVDTIGSYVDWMNNVFPLALSELKKIAEN